MPKSMCAAAILCGPQCFPTVSGLSSLRFLCNPQARAQLADIPGAFRRNEFFEMEAEMSDDEGHSGDDGDEDANADGMLVRMSRIYQCSESVHEEQVECLGCSVGIGCTWQYTSSSDDSPMAHCVRCPDCLTGMNRRQQDLEVCWSLILDWRCGASI